jgi:hypothetical protein
MGLPPSTLVERVLASPAAEEPPRIIRGRNGEDK